MRNRMRYPTVAAWLGLFWATIFSALALAQNADPNTSGNTIYMYDGLGRVTTTFYSDSNKGQIYSYDAAGNILSTYSGNVSLATFDPASQQLTVTEPAGTGQTGSVTLTINRQGANVISTVKYQTVDGTAVAGANYGKSSGSLTFQVGQSTKTIQIPILYHAGYDGPVSFTVQLVPVSADTATVVDTAQVTINDFDPPPVFTLSGPMSVGQGKTGTYTVTRTNQVNFTQTIDYTTADATAVAGLSYAANSGTLSFAPTDTSQTFTVDTIALNGYLGPVKFSTSISNPSVGGTFTTSSLLTNIPDSHNPFTITLGGTSYGFPGQCQVITVATSNPAAFPVVLNYAITSGSQTPNAYPYPSVGGAIDGVDYSTTYQTGTGIISIATGTVSLPASMSNVNIPVVPSNLECSGGGLGIGNLLPVQPGVKNYVLTLTFAPGTPYSGWSQIALTPAIQYQPNPLAPTLNPHGTLSTSWVGTETRTQGAAGGDFSLGVAPPPVASGSPAWDRYIFMTGSTTLCNVPSTASSLTCAIPQSKVGSNGIAVVVKACAGSVCSPFSSETDLSYGDPTGGGN